jgi:hypothetical protein
MTQSWKEYSGMQANAASKRDTDIAMSRARLYEAGAIPDVITAHETALRGEYDKKIEGFKTGSNYKMLQEGFDIARGAKENPYAQNYAEYKPGQDLGQYFAANYVSGEVDADPREALYRARRAAAGGNLRRIAPSRAGSGPGGGGGEGLPEYQLAPGQNPWIA